MLVRRNNSEFIMSTKENPKGVTSGFKLHRRNPEEMFEMEEFKKSRKLNGHLMNSLINKERKE